MFLYLDSLLVCFLIFPHLFLFFSFFVTFIYSAFVSLLVAFIHSLSSSRSLPLLNKGTEACTEDIQQMDFLHVIKVTLALLYWEISVVLFN